MLRFISGGIASKWSYRVLVASGASLERRERQESYLVI